MPKMAAGEVSYVIGFVFWFSEVYESNIKNKVFVVDALKNISTF
jgi:hypothetical protein